MTTVFKTSCPLSLFSCLSFPFPAPLTSNRVPQPPVSPTTPSLSPLPQTHHPRRKFKQLALSSADTSSMQIESPPTLRLSHFFPVSRSRFPLPFRDYVVMRMSCLYSRTLLTSLSFALALVSLALSCTHPCCHSCAVLSILLPIVTLIRSECGPHMNLVFLPEGGPWDW